MNWIGRTSPDEVTVERSSERLSALTTVTSGVSVRVAKMLAIITTTIRTAATAPIMIFDLRLSAILFSFLATRNIKLMTTLRQNQGFKSVKPLLRQDLSWSFKKLYKFSWRIKRIHISRLTMFGHRFTIY